MAGRGVRIEGLRETVRSLERFGVEVQDLKAAFKKIGSLVANDAKSLAPHLSGKLAGSIRPSNTKNKSIVRAGGAAIPYAGVQNYGWPAHSIEGKHFMEQAVERNQHEAVQMMEEELNDLIRRYDLKS